MTLSPHVVLLIPRWSRRIRRFNCTGVQVSFSVLIVSVQLWQIDSVGYDQVVQVMLWFHGIQWMWCCTCLSTYVIDNSVRVWSTTCVLLFDFAGFMIDIVDCVKGFKVKVPGRRHSLIVIATSVSYKDVMVIVVQCWRMSHETIRMYKGRSSGKGFSFTDVALQSRHGSSKVKRNYLLKPRPKP